MNEEEIRRAKRILFISSEIPMPDGNRCPKCNEILKIKRLRKWGGLRNKDLILYECCKCGYEFAKVERLFSLGSIEGAGISKR